VCFLHHQQQQQQEKQREPCSSYAAGVLPSINNNNTTTTSVEPCSSYAAGVLHLLSPAPSVTLLGVLSSPPPPAVILLIPHGRWGCLHRYQRGAPAATIAIAATLDPAHLTRSAAMHSTSSPPV
jgi:hypothetical protein